MQTLENVSMKLNWNLEGHFLLNENLRKQAQETIEGLDFPTTRNEAWKYTRVAKIKNALLSVGKLQSVTSKLGLDDNSLKFVFVNGHFAKDLSSSNYPDGVKILALSSMDKEELNVLGTSAVLENEIFNAINTAYATDGLYVHVSAKMQIEPVIEIIHVSTGDAVLTNLRHSITAEAFAEVKLIQHFVTEKGEGSFTNVYTEVNVAKNAKVVIDKLQEENDTAYHVATEQVAQAQDSNFTINTITLNGALVRNNLNIDVNGSNCETHLNGAYILNGNQHVDNHTIVDHKVSHCESFELYKGVIDGKATGVFNGKVFVRKDAQKINAFQSNGNVLLSDDASVNSKPELEIYADDVKCSHGSTTGQLDEEAVFYLRARGLSEASARQLMVGAFVGEVFEKIENEAVVERIHEVLRERFDWSI